MGLSFMETTTTLPLLVQAGAVGISFGLIYIIYWLIKVVVGNHIQHNTEAMAKQAKALNKLATAITVLSKNVNKK